MTTGTVGGSSFALHDPVGILRFLTLCFVLFALLNSCILPKEKTFRKSRMLMDTVVTITVVADSAEKAEKSMDKAFSVISGLEALVNFYSAASELSLINKNAGIEPVKVSAEMIDLIERALQVAEKTGGAFDITIGPLIGLYDFHSKKRPNEALTRENLGLVDYRSVVVDRDKSTVYLRRKGMLLDLGGIAKGYAADRSVEELKRQGIRSGLVAVAGDIKAFGTKPDGTAWKVGVRNPRMQGEDDEIIATLELRDAAVSTSGDYERFFMEGETRYHHILDPATGRPVRGCRSVSVIAQTGTDTDSFSTAVFILGPAKGIALVEEMGFEGLIVDDSGEVWTTGGLGRTIEFKRDIKRHDGR